MSLILNLETSTKNCSVSIAKNGICLTSVEESSEDYFHSEKLHAFIQYVINISGIHLKDLKSVCVNKGPGSYTSLRIGASAARGLCSALNIPLLSVDTLTIMVMGYNFIKKGFLIPMVHAKSDFFYISLFNESKKRINPIKIKKLDDDFFKSISKKYKKVHFIGNTFSLKKKFFSTKKNNFFYKNPSAMDMSLISYKKFCKKSFSNMEKFIPFYL
ncbi:tRNA (adenosine(37)-N6)-threonylcarbamoyltransferase complex dimerization subunit type 1 TsaB [Blattabacterium cuenoti]|uniref:Peptidase M22, glycoprotease n=1 Tax=Blattabacterium cuenoti STAT TaxID=1457030 RepID=A0A224AJM1_9FLAO|nr:tRNA (adenosine(37)-N6)-threonylcarbamoyltransferase complex dimerization subunit type 1 TsaB [Blattabacterium cuenoti]BBA17008.1 peptidase M22, glycoprotease [Blattabacterium cuenoti STAT]